MPTDKVPQKPKVIWSRQNPDCLLWWRISPTLRCTCECTYCSAAFRHRLVHISAGRRRVSPEQWIEICNKLDTDILVTGGEPFLYSGLLDVIEGIEHKVRVNSNLGPLTETDIARLVARGNMMFMASYHHKQPGAISFEAFARKVLLLKAGDFKVKVNMVAIGGAHSHKVLKPVKAAFQTKYGIKADISKDARTFDVWPGTQFEGEPQHVVCKTGCLRLVGPDGFRYPCQSKMTRGVGRMEDLLADAPAPMAYKTQCGDFGLCLPCDRHGPRKIVEDGGQ